MDDQDQTMHGATCLWNRGGVYYFRIRIPADLRVLYAKPEIRFSLNTRDKSEAVLRASGERSRVLHEFAAHRRTRKQAFGDTTPRTFTPIRSVDPGFIDFVCDSRLRMTLEGDDEFRPMLGAQWREDIRPAELDREFYPLLKKALSTGNTAWIRNVLEAHLQILGFTLACSEEDYRTLAFRFMQALGKEYDYLFQRDAGEVVETNVVVPATALPNSEITLDELYRQWSDAARRPPKTLETFKRAVERFKNFIGGKNPELVTRKDAIAFRNHILLPRDDGRCLSMKSVKLQFDCLRAIFRRAVANEEIATNPFHDIPFDRQAQGEKPRMPFEPDDLKLIFSTPIYTEGKFSEGGGAREASYWLPLLALYSGARLEELGQLRVKDVKRFGDLGWYIEITPQAGSVKTASSDRHVPLHSKIIDLGFVEYLQRIKAAKHERVFPFLNPDKYGAATGNWSKWFGRHLRALGVTDRRKVFHSFRHSFKDAARTANVMEEVHDALTGHAGTSSVGRQYGNQRYPLEPLFDAIERIRYPGLTIPKLKC